MSVSLTIGTKGTVTIPVAMRERLGLQAGSLIIIEERDGNLIITPAVAVPQEDYSPHRRAEFLLTNAIDKEDYARAVETVKRMGLDPDDIAHHGP